MGIHRVPESKQNHIIVKPTVIFIDAIYTSSVLGLVSRWFLLVGKRATLRSLRHLAAQSPVLHGEEKTANIRHDGKEPQCLPDMGWKQQKDTCEIRKTIAVTDR